MEIAVQIALILILSALPAFAAAWFTKRSGEVLAEAFRPLSGHKVALDDAWPRGVQEEEPRPWGYPVVARRSAVSDGSVEAATEPDQLPVLHRVRRS